MELDISYAKYLISALYFLTLIGVGWYYRQLPPLGKRYTKPILFVLFVSGVSGVLQGIGIGGYNQPAVDTAASIPRFIDDTIAYATLFGLTGIIAGASRRMAALLAGLSAGSRIVIEVGGLHESLVAIALLLSLSSYGFRIYLLWWPVWRTAKKQNPRQTLLFRKSRDTLMFLIGVSILVGFVGASGLLTNFVQQFILVYIDFCIRIGFIGFVVSKISALWAE